MCLKTVCKYCVLLYPLMVLLTELTVHCFWVRKNKVGLCGNTLDSLYIFNVRIVYKANIEDITSWKRRLVTIYEVREQQAVLLVPNGVLDMQNVPENDQRLERAWWPSRRLTCGVLSYRPVVSRISLAANATWGRLQIDVDCKHVTTRYLHHSHQQPWWTKLNIHLIDK